MSRRIFKAFALILNVARSDSDLPNQTEGSPRPCRGAHAFRKFNEELQALRTELEKEPFAHWEILSQYSGGQY